jgi:hypothetical protein
MTRILPKQFHRQLIVVSFGVVLALSAGIVSVESARLDTAATAPVISSLSVNTQARSGRFQITGMNFGATQGTSRVLVNGQTAFLTRWSDASITAYVPEAATLGSDPVVVETSGGTSSPATLNVTNRPAISGRIKWRFITDGYSYHRAGVSSDGTIYVNDTNGFVYALAPDGGLKWITRVSDLGAYGPVSVGGNGTIYVATIRPSGVGSYQDGTIVALNPDGTEKWAFVAPDTQTVRAGPNVGPDGKVYVIIRPENPNATNLAALDPNDGHVVWNFNDDYFKYGHQGKELFFGTQFVYFQFESFTFPHGGFYAHRLDTGDRVRAIQNYATDGVVVVAPDQTAHNSMESWAPALASLIWTFPIFGQGPTTAPEVGIDSVHYIVQNYYRLYAINPNGSEKWRYDDSDPANGFHILFDPLASPANQVIFHGGLITYGKPGFFLGINPANGSRLWRQPLPVEPGFGMYGQVRPLNRAIFAPDGQTAYVAADVAGNYDYAYFYAIDTSNTLPCSFSISPQNQTIANNGGTFPIDITATSENCSWTATSNAPWLSISSGSSGGGNGTVNFSATANTTTSSRTGTLTIAGQTVTVTQPGVPPGAPTVQITYPAQNATFTVPTTIFVSADAAASTGRSLSRVDFYYNGSSLIGSDTSAPYQVAWDDPPGNGNQALTAVAIDDAGVSTTSAPVTITINTSGLLPLPIPKPTLNNPTQGQTFAEPATIAISATPAASQYPVSRMEFYAGTMLLGSDTTSPYNFTWTNVPAGRYTVSARTVANSGARATSALADITVNPGDSIQGTITDRNGAPLSGLTVTLSGAQTGNSATDNNGNYRFSNLLAGSNYTVTPGNTAFDSFTAQSVNSLSGPVTVNFRGTTRTYTISGQVGYANGSATVTETLLTLTGGAGFPSQTTTTAADGTYSFTNIPAGGNYLVTPTRNSDASGISAFDASLTGRFAASLIALNSDQQIAADANNSNSVSAPDALLIANSALNMPNQSVVGSWKFAQPSRAISNLAADAGGQDFSAVLVGDVSGNWTGSLRAAAQSENSAVSISVGLPNRSGPHGAGASIPINVSDLTNFGVFSYDLDISFDPTVLQPRNPVFNLTGSLSNGLTVNANTATPGRIRINGFSSANAQSGQGALLQLNFDIVGNTGSQTPLAWQRFQFNEGNPSVTLTNGSFTVTGPTASAGTVNGRIVDDNGLPVPGAVVRLTGTQNRRFITDASGFYSFDNVAAGGFYTVTPSRVNYVFSPGERSFNQIGESTNAAFTASLINGGSVTPLDMPDYFVRQHYLDFLGREPDESGFNFWSDQILSCGADAGCSERRSINVSAAYFLSIEFQQTGGLVDGLYRASYNRRPSYHEFLPDAAALTRDVVVGRANWAEKLEANKQAFVDAWMQRADFLAAYDGLTNAAFVDSLISHTAGFNGDRSALVSGLNGGTLTRAAALRQIVENEGFVAAKRNEMFVMMEYFGYLRRDPDASGYQYWLNKLSEFNGNFERAEMVKAFIVSSEYRDRFSR